jgi:hypothetical protein
MLVIAPAFCATGPADSRLFKLLDETFTAGAGTCPESEVSPVAGDSCAIRRSQSRSTAALYIDGKLIATAEGASCATNARTACPTSRPSSAWNE